MKEQSETSGAAAWAGRRVATFAENKLFLAGGVVLNLVHV